MRILVVEDEHKIAGAIRKGLEQESFAVDVAYDADDGLSSALTGEHDVIILDRMLPGMIEAWTCARKSDPRASTRPY